MKIPWECTDSKLMNHFTFSKKNFHFVRVFTKCCVQNCTKTGIFQWNSRRFRFHFTFISEKLNINLPPSLDFHLYNFFEKIIWKLVEYTFISIFIQVSERKFYCMHWLIFCKLDILNCFPCMLSLCNKFHKEKYVHKVTEHTIHFLAQSTEHMDLCC